MRIALISDIHAHLHALDAVLADLGRRDVGKIVCLGDVATLGPHPRQVVRRLGSLGCRWVRGNHDAAILDPHRAGELKFADSLLPSLHWCRSQLTPAEMGLVRTSEDTIHLSLGDGRSLLCFHGSPVCSTDLITPFTTDAELTSLFAAHPEPILAGGHTHMQMRRDFDGTTFINPGSVGSVFRQAPGTGEEVTVQPWAEYCILDTGRGGVEVEMHKVPFDAEHFLRSVAGSDTPLKDWWLAQYR